MSHMSDIERKFRSFLHEHAHKCSHLMNIVLLDLFIAIDILISMPMYCHLTKSHRDQMKSFSRLLIDKLYINSKIAIRYD
jgi:hypothetical protein